MGLTIFWRALQLAGVRASTNTGLAAFNKMEEKVLALEAEVEAAEQVSVFAAPHACIWCHASRALMQVHGCLAR